MIAGRVSAGRRVTRLGSVYGFTSCDPWPAPSSQSQLRGSETQIVENFCQILLRCPCKLCTDLTCRTAHYEQPRLLKQLPPQQHLGSPGFESEYKLLFRLKISAVLHHHLSVSSGRWWMRDKVWLDCSPA